MKILQVNNNHRIVGGSDTVYLNTGELLIHRGHAVSWFAGRSTEDLPSADAAYFPEAFTTATSGLVDLPRYFRNGAARRAMARLLDDKGPFDVAHLHIYYGRLTASILSPLRVRGVPIVQSLHEYKLACPVYTLERGGATCEKCIGGSTVNCVRHRCKGGSLVNSAIVLAEYHTSRWQGDVRFVDRFICVSDFQRRLLERAGIPSKKLTTLHNFVDAAGLAPAKPIERGDYLLYFGRVEELKGVPTLVEAALKRNVPLCIAGTGAWEDQLRARISHRPHIQALGFVSGDPLRTLVAGARAVVVPSEWYENCPMTILEAKAVGTPVIAARIGGIPELVRDGVDGFLFEPGNVEELVSCFDKLDASDAEALSNAALEDAQARFSPEAHYRALMEIYNALKQNGKSA